MIGRGEDGRGLVLRRPAGHGVVGGWGWDSQIVILINCRCIDDLQWRLVHSAPWKAWFIAVVCLLALDSAASSTWHFTAHVMLCLALIHARSRCTRPNAGRLPSWPANTLPRQSSLFSMILNRACVWPCQRCDVDLPYSRVHRKPQPTNVQRRQLLHHISY